jgi:hypothetical protein
MKQDSMYNGYMSNDFDQAHNPLIVVTEALPSEEATQDTPVMLTFCFLRFLHQKTKLLFI